MAEIHLEEDGSLRLVTAVRDVGVGAYTMHKQVAAEVLGVDAEIVRIHPSGTDGPYDDGVRGAKGTHIEGQAVRQATHALIEGLRKGAAAKWQVPVERVLWERGRARLKGSVKSLSLRDLARASSNHLPRGFGHYKADKPDIYSFQSMVAEVEVDKETGEVKVKNLYIAYDQTKVNNPVIHQGQIEGATIQGVGFSLMEHFIVEDGRVLTVNLGDYKIPTIRDLPPLTTCSSKQKKASAPTELNP